MTCAPATLTALARYWGREADHLEVAEAIWGVPNQLMIRGHTDAAPWSAGAGTNNWRLSVIRPGQWL